MKILLIVDDYLPDSIKIAAKMMHELAVEFKSQNHEVLVVTPDSYQNYSGNTNHIYTLDGIQIYRFPSGRLKNISKIIRLINEFLLPYRAWYYGKKMFQDNKFDVIIYYSPSIFWGWLVKKLKKLWNAKTYLILRDIFPQWAIDNGILRKNSIITFFLLLMEKLNYQPAEKIGLMSPGNLKWFENYYRGNAILEVLFNWAGESSFKKSDKSYRNLLNLNNKIVFFYGGNIGHAQDMSQILRLAKSLLNHPEAFILLVGSGDEVNLVRDTITKDNLTNLILLDPLPQEEFQSMMSEFDIGLFCLNPNHTTHNFPGKILGYLSQGIPILGSVNKGNDLKEILEKAGNGFVSHSGDDTLFYQNAVLLLNEKTRIEMGKRSKILLEDTFSISKITKQLLSH